MERRKILIVTKTYPSISRKYKETVCTAGILLNDDEQPVEWIRIYPIRFRKLGFEQRYKRYSVISAEVEKNDKDYRKESYRINDESIQVVRQIGTTQSWQERKSLILPLSFSSVAEIKSQKKSLGIIKPQSIEKYFCKATDREWSPKQLDTLAQGDLFEESVDLEKIPHQFGYQFTGGDGTKHRYTISDWEISELYRKCRDSSQLTTWQERERDSLEKVKQKYSNEFLSKKDLYFIVGNLKNHINTFMIIGIFYPPIIPEPEMVNLSLFDF